MAFSGKTSIVMCDKIGSYMPPLTGKTEHRILYIRRSKLKREIIANFLCNSEKKRKNIEVPISFIGHIANEKWHCIQG